MFDIAMPSRADAIAEIAHPLQTSADLDPLLDRIGDARVVLLGEATHGTSEYYLWRARISQRLIQEKGFSFIAVEGDWPDCYRVNRFVKGGAGESARDVLDQFARWPTWMWANWEVAALADWMRRYNAAQPADGRVGFYGLDMYSLWESLAEVTGYLEQNAPDAVHAAYQAYSCFQPYGEDAQTYARATYIVPTSCEDDVVKLLLETQRRAHELRSDDGDSEAAFNAEQNARVAASAEQYYRTMIYGGPESWNIRDTHMVDTLHHLLRHHGENAKAIVWEHNTHIGDARATPMARAGMVNVGQLVRDQYGDDTVLVGFGGYRGSVIAGRSWGAPMERMPVAPARAESWEGVLHDTLGRDSLLIFAEAGRADELFARTRGHRAIGVVYDPELDRHGSFVPTELSRRYDAFVYLEDTQALHPLHLEPEPRQTPPETYPWGV